MGSVVVSILPKSLRMWRVTSTVQLQMTVRRLANCTSTQSHPSRLFLVGVSFVSATKLILKRFFECRLEFIMGRMHAPGKGICTSDFLPMIIDQVLT